MKRYQLLSIVLMSVLFKISHVDGEAFQDWTEWSNWSAAGSCQGTVRPYARSRMCVEPSVKPSNIINDYCILGDWEVEYTNRTVSSCVQTERLLILGILTIVTLFCIILVILFTVLCIREWAKRKTYHVREATISSERMDNSPIYENISMTDIVHDSSIYNGGIPPLGTSVREVADLRAKLSSLTSTMTCIENKYAYRKEEEGENSKDSDQQKI